MLLLDIFFVAACAPGFVNEAGSARKATLTASWKDEA